MQDWWILTDHFGVDNRTPDILDVSKAIECLNKSSPDPEHPNLWLRFGDRGGCLWVLDYYPSGSLILTKYLDQDLECMEIKLVAPSMLFGMMPLCKAFSLLLDGNTVDLLLHFKLCANQKDI